RVENYSKDLNRAITTIRGSGLNPLFPRKLWKSVLRDEFIKLSELTTLTKQAPTKKIDNQNAWQRAWQATADAIVFAFPSHRSEVSAYKKHIQKLFDRRVEALHPNILLYNKAFCQLVRLRSDLLFNKFNNAEGKELHATYLTPSSTLYAQLS
ncbi:hypothetical protein GYMLUDRAFT_141693, partial [Collybiopsis luxurians FD-317 M1]